MSLCCAVRCGSRFLEAVGYEMRNRNGHMADIAHCIEWTEAQCLFGLLDCDLALAAPCPGDRTEAEGERR